MRLLCSLCVRFACQVGCDDDCVCVCVCVSVTQLFFSFRLGNQFFYTTHTHTQLHSNIFVHFVRDFHSIYVCLSIGFDSWSNLPIPFFTNWPVSIHHNAVKFHISIDLSRLFRNKFSLSCSLNLPSSFIHSIILLEVMSIDRIIQPNK